MKIYELTYAQCEKIAKAVPDWILENRLDWVTRKHPFFRIEKQFLDVPEDIASLLNKEAW